MLDLAPDDPLAIAAVTAIQEGRVESLDALLRGNPELVIARIRTRSLLHIATDWPGHFPNVAETIATLVAAGADPNARGPGPFPETPLHWAASSDDVAAIDALLDNDADIEAAEASIAGGTALDNAIGYGQWLAARRLVERGAKVDKLWHAAALGMIDRLEVNLAQPTRLPQDEINAAFWQACHGGQLAVAEFLLARGADKNWIPPWAKQTPLDIARSSDADQLVRWLLDHDAKSMDQIG
jgi:uncharacterized protein